MSRADATFAIPFPALDVENDDRWRDLDDERRERAAARATTTDAFARALDPSGTKSLHEARRVDALADEREKADDAWVNFASDAAVAARTEAEAAARDAAFEEALARVRASRRAMAKKAAARATMRGEFYEDELRHESGLDDAAHADGAAARGEREGSSTAWRGDFSAFDGEPSRAPRALPPAWTAPIMDADLDAEPSEEFKREVADKATRASLVAEGIIRESDAVAEMSEQIRRLNSALSACERRENAAEIAATAEAERAAALEHEYLEMKARVKARDADISELNKVMFVLKKRVEDLTDALDEARRECESYRMEIAELKVSDGELRRAVEKRAVSERMAQTANESTKRDVLSLQSKCRLLEEENERLSNRLSQSEEKEYESSKSAQRFHQLAEASARENEIMQRANDVATAENAQLRAELKDLHREVQEMKKLMNARRSASSVGAPAPQQVRPAPAPAPATEPAPKPAESKVTTQLTIEPAARRNEPSPANVSAEVGYDTFDDSEYKRRMRDGSGFFYDMRGVNPPKAQAKPRRSAPTQPRPGERYPPPAEPTKPFTSYEDWMRSISELENEHMRLALERDSIEAQLNKLPPGAGRTMLERERKASALERLDEVHRALKDNRNALKAARDGRGR